MTDPTTSPLADLEAAVGASQASRAVDAAVRSFRVKASALEVVRVASRAAASRYDLSSGAAPRGLVALSAAANVVTVLQPRFHPLPALQAVAFAAAEKEAAVPLKSSLLVSGEVTHLGRSFLFAVRAGECSEAESLFLGFVDEGWERKMAGDILFRAAIEDMGAGGRKLVVAVKLWQLARSLGFKEARAILRPAVAYLVKGPRDRHPFETILGALGKEWVDLEGLASGGRPLDDPGRTKVAATVTADSEAACIAATLDLLRSGYAAASIAEGFGGEAARRVVAADGYDVEVARALIFAHAARFVTTFSRTSERLYALFQAALRVRSPVHDPATPSVPNEPREGEALCHLAEAFDARRAMEAAARAGSYVAHGYSGTRMLDVLANYACRDSSRANDAINLILADVCSAEFLATNDRQVAMALATMIAASPKDQAAYESWAPLFAA